LCRRGYSLIEVLAAIAVLTSLVAAWLPLQHTAAKLRRASQWRQGALFEAAGVMERLAAWPAADLTPERTAKLDLSPEARRTLPNPELHVNVQPTGEGALPGVRVAVRITWNDSSTNQKPQQVELVAWRYEVDKLAGPDEEGQP
jgi:prepilin-type N-terminal cleavage/methylation domain-containing protein